MQCICNLENFFLQNVTNKISTFGKFIITAKLSQIDLSMHNRKHI